MLIKNSRLTVLAAVLCFSAMSAYAGSQNNQAIPVPNSFSSFVYAQADVGYSDTNWIDFDKGNVYTSAGRGGMAYGGALGFSFASYFGVEVGGMYLPESKYSIVDQGTTNVTGSGKRNAWAGYFVGKMDVQMTSNLDAFGKVGVAYMNLKNETVNNTTKKVSTQKGYYISPVFAFGMAYHVNKSLLAGVQYMLIPGHKTSDINNQAPAANIVALSVGYRFTV